MELKSKIQPLHNFNSHLKQGTIIKNLDSANYQVKDRWQKVYNVDSQCHLLPSLQHGDQVVFCLLDNNEIAILHRLVSPNQKKQDLELSIPSCESTKITMSEEGIVLQAGATKLTLQPNGTLKLDATQIKQKATDTFQIQGRMVYIN